MAEDLEADPVGESPSSDAPLTPSPASESPPVPSTVEDMYDFGPPDETPVAEIPAAQPADRSPAATVAAPTVSPALAQRAAALGYTPELLSKVSDPVAVEAMVRTAEQAAVNAAIFAQNQARQQFAQPAPVQQQTPQLPPPPKAPEPFNEAAIRAQLTNYEESLANQLVANQKNLHDQSVAQHKLEMRIWEQDKYNRDTFEYMQRKDQEVQQIRQQHQMELVNRDYEAFAGKLTEHQQKLVNDQQNRANIYAMADAMIVGMVNRGQTPPSTQDAFKMAMHAVLADKLEGAATEKVRKEVQQHQQRAVGRPSSSRATPANKPATQEDRLHSASRFSEDFFIKLGLPAGRAAEQPEA